MNSWLQFEPDKLVSITNIPSALYWQQRIMLSQPFARGPIIMIGFWRFRTESSLNFDLLFDNYTVMK